MGENFWKDRVVRKEDLESPENEKKGIFTYKRRIYTPRKIDDDHNILECLKDWMDD